MSTRRLKDKVAVITGAGSGIGRAIATLFGAEGAIVVASDVVPKTVKGATQCLHYSRTGEEGLAGTAAAIRNAGGRVQTVLADVSVPADVERLMAETVERLERIDILCNNAGIGHVGTVVDVTPEEWDRVMAVNAKGVFLGCKFAIPYMLQQGGGVIINTASIGGMVGRPLRAVYSASKGAIIALTKQVAIEYADKNIRVNCICPGTTDTPWVERLLAIEPTPEAAAKALETLRQRQPMGRLGTADEIAKAALFLASDDASFCTGSELVVDGGLTAR